MMNAARPPSSAGNRQQVEESERERDRRGQPEVRAPSPILDRRRDLTHADDAGNLRRVLREVRDEQNDAADRLIGNAGELNAALAHRFGKSDAFELRHRGKPDATQLLCARVPEVGARFGGYVHFVARAVAQVYEIEPFAERTVNTSMSFSPLVTATPSSSTIRSPIFRPATAAGEPGTTMPTTG